MQAGQARGPPGRVTGDSPRSNVIRCPVRDARDAVDRLDVFEREIESACHNLVALASCPVCGEAEVDFDPRENECFAASCLSSSCAARWELRHEPET